jgi:hypothetical protein
LHWKVKLVLIGVFASLAAMSGGFVERGYSTLGFFW